MRDDWRPYRGGGHRLHILDVRASGKTSDCWEVSQRGKRSQVARSESLYPVSERCCTFVPRQSQWRWRGRGPAGIEPVPRIAKIDAWVVAAELCRPVNLYIWTHPHATIDQSPSPLRRTLSRCRYMRTTSRWLRNAQEHPSRSVRLSQVSVWSIVCGG